MLKITTGIIIFVICAIQFPGSGATNNDIDTKIKKMWVIVKQYMNVYESKTLKGADTNEEKERLKILVKDIRVKFNKRFTDLEKMARLTNTTSNMDVDLVFYEIMYGDTSSLFQRNVEKINETIDIDSDKKTKLIAAMQHFYNNVLKCMWNYIEECLSYPMYIFEEYDEKYKTKRSNILSAVDEQCDENMKKQSIRVGVKLDNLKLPDDKLEIVMKSLFG